MSPSDLDDFPRRECSHNVTGLLIDDGLFVASKIPLRMKFAIG
jgi:hypothetical protein